MTTDYAISHEQARAALHTGRRHLTGGAAKQLEAHLAGCAACRAYAAHLAAAEPALTAALRAQWDAAQPPLPERAFADRVRARAARRHWQSPSWLSVAPVTAGVALLVLVVVWISSGWGSQGFGPVDAPQPTEVVVTSNPLPTPPAEATVALTPDLLGRWVAFLVRDKANRDEIFLMSGRSGPIGQVNSTGHDLAWSPDGTRLAFVSNRSGRPEVYLFDPDFWQSTPLTFGTAEQPALDFSLAWSPDGQWLAVTAISLERGLDYDGGELYLLDPQVSGYQRFPADAVLLAERVTGPAQWSPDGAWLAYGTRDENGVPALFAVGVAAVMRGANPQADLPVRQLTKYPPLADGSHDIYLGFAWSPDSSHLAYLRQGPWVGDVLSATLGADFNASIALVALDEPDAPHKIILDLTPSPNGIMGLSWSPDGQYLLYLSDGVTAASLGDGTASSGCWTPRLLPAGGEPIALTGVCYLPRTALPEWTPDSRYLLLTTEEGLAVIDVPAALAAGGQAQPVFLPLPADVEGLAHSPTWQPAP